MEEKKKTFADLKEGDSIWIGWCDERRGKFGNIREIEVKRVMASRTDDHVYLRFAPDDEFEIEYNDTEVWPEDTVGFGTDTSVLDPESYYVPSYVGMTFRDVAAQLDKKICNYIAEKTLEMSRLQKKLEIAAEELGRIRSGK